jgi:hypothetical protein
MSDRFDELEAALDRVIASARAHLATVKTADGAPDDDAVWNAYVALNNASHDYDLLLEDVYGEVTPWDLETITGEDDEGLATTMISVQEGPPGGDPHPRVISVRQRRDYRVPSVAALIRVAEEGRPSMGDGEEYEPIHTVADAVIELLQSGDGSLGMLDVPELDPLDGVVLVAEVGQALDPAVLETEPPLDPDAPFRLAATDRALSRLHERAISGSEQD